MIPATTVVGIYASSRRIDSYRIGRSLSVEIVTFIHDTRQYIRAKDEHRCERHGSEKQFDSSRRDQLKRDGRYDDHRPTSRNLDGMDLTIVLLTVSTLLVGLLAGLFFAYSVSVVPALDTLSASTYTKLMQSISDAILNAVFGVTFFGAVVVPTVGAAVVLLRGDWIAQYGQLILAGTVIHLLGTVAVTAAVHIPMNGYIATWAPGAPPDDWSAVRTRWAQWNHIRTIASVISFVILHLGLVVRLQSVGVVT